MEKWKKFLIGGYVSVIIGLFSFSLTFIIIPFLFSIIPYHHIPIAIILIVFGIFDIHYALSHKDDSEEKYFLPYGGISLRKKRIKKWIKKEIMEGLGTELNPYKFVDSSKIPEYIKIEVKNTNSYILINNCILSELYLENCTNVIIDSNRISSVLLEYCSNITIINNVINFLRLEYSIGNVIDNNQLPEYNLTHLKQNKIHFPKGESIMFLAFCLTGIFLILFFTIMIFGFRFSFNYRVGIVLLILTGGGVVFGLIFLKSLNLVDSMKLYKKSLNNLNIITNNSPLIQDY